MVINGSGIRDTARVLKISTITVLNELKKLSEISQINNKIVESCKKELVFIKLYQVKDEENKEAEMDEMWSFVGKKEEQRWL